MRCLALVGSLVLLVAACFCAPSSAASLDAVKGLARTLSGKAAEAADKSEPVEEKGGVRASMMHAGVHMMLENGLDAIGKKYPVVALAAPTVKKLAKPVANVIHGKINDWGAKSATSEAPAASSEAPAATSTEAPAQASSEAGPSSTAAPERQSTAAPASTPAPTAEPSATTGAESEEATAEPEEANEEAKKKNKSRKG